MNIRTDIAIEKSEMLNNKNIEGVSVFKEKRGKTEITQVHIMNSQGEEQIGKPMGKYITLAMPEFSHESELLDGRLDVLTDMVKELIPPKTKRFLVVGLGNEDITPDALGPLCVSKIFSTRHLEKIAQSDLGLPKLNPVASISTGVLGQTGIETAEYVKGIVNIVKPELVIMVDALASAKKENLCKTIQLTNTGITPGSGVGNYRNHIDKDLLGTSVISIGVPTVINIENTIDMFVTPKEIDMIVKRAASLIAMGINCAIQPKMEPELFLALS